jgi:hypothetical protein
VSYPRDPHTSLHLICFQTRTLGQGSSSSTQSITRLSCPMGLRRAYLDLGASNPRLLQGNRRKGCYSLSLQIRLREEPHSEPSHCIHRGRQSLPTPWPINSSFFDPSHPSLSFLHITSPDLISCSYPAYIKPASNMTDSANDSAMGGTEPPHNHMVSRFPHPHLVAASTQHPCVQPRRYRHSSDGLRRFRNLYYS